MADWGALIDEAWQLPPGPGRQAAFLAIAEQADADGDRDAGFHARMELIGASYYWTIDTDALTAFAWCLARSDEEPERFASWEHRLGWVHKWMPELANEHPNVPGARVAALIDDLEARHVAAGAGRRQSLAVRIQVALDDGDPAVGELLADWRASARSSLSDCEACEVLLEARALDRLGRADEAIGVAAGLIAGTVPYCGDGPAPIGRTIVPLLVEAGRAEDAGRLFRTALRAASRPTPRQLYNLAPLAALAARTGDPATARHIVEVALPRLPEQPRPLDRLHIEIALARALAALAPDEPLGAALATDLPDGIGPVPADGWRAGPLRSALERAVRASAARYDERNGTTGVSELVERDLAAPDLPRVTLAATARPPRPAPSPVPAAAPAADPTRPPAEPPPDDALTLLAWAETERERWNGAAVLAVARARWADAATDPATAAVAALLLADELDPDEVHDRLDPADLPSWAGARLAVLRTEQPDPDERATRLAEAARLVAEDDDDPFLAFDVATSIAAVAAATDDGRAGAVVAEGEALLATSPHGDRRRIREQKLRSIALHLAVERLHDERDEVAAEALAAVVEEARAGVPDDGLSRSQAWILANIARALLILGRDDEAAEQAQVVVDAAGTDPEIAARALLLLADARAAVAGPAAAVEPQQRAVALLDQPHQRAQRAAARRVLGILLARSGRADDATVVLAQAAAELEDAGLVELAAATMLERADAELELDDPAAAARIAEALLALLPRIDEAERTVFELDALQLAARAAQERGADSEAVGRWLRVAEVATAADLPSGRPRMEAALALAGADDADGALALLAEVAADDPERSGVTPAEVAWNQSRVLLRVGRPADAAAAATRSAEDLAADGEPVAEGRALLLAAEGWLAADEEVRARAAMDRALAIGVEHGATELQAQAHRWLADLAYRDGRYEDGAAHDRAATDLEGA